MHKHTPLQSHVFFCVIHLACLSKKNELHNISNKITF